MAVGFPRMTSAMTGLHASHAASLHYSHLAGRSTVPSAMELTPMDLDPTSTDPLTRTELAAVMRTCGRLYCSSYAPPIFTIPTRGEAAANRLHAMLGGGVKTEPGVKGKTNYMWGIWGYPLLALADDFKDECPGLLKAIDEEYPTRPIEKFRSAPSWWSAPLNDSYEPKFADEETVSSPAATLIAGARALAALPIESGMSAPMQAMLTSMRAAVAEFDAGKDT